MFTRMLTPVTSALPLAVTVGALVATPPAVAAPGHDPDPAVQSGPGAPDPIWIIADGDIPACGKIKKGPPHRALATGALAMQLKKMHSSALFLGLGDESNGTGTANEYAGCYNQTGWGNLFSSTYPSPGNHEYKKSGTANGYFWYFKPRKPGTANKPYYSFDVDSWHFISLDSECTHAPQPTFKGCKNWQKIKATQQKWLKNDLQQVRSAHKSTCILAFWHEPLFSSSVRGPTGKVSNRPAYPFWRLLYQYRAAIVLNGHLHGYERFNPQNPNGKRTANGIREFVPATGGSQFYNYRKPTANSAKIIPKTPGALLLELRNGSYRWWFYSTAGKVLDSGRFKPCPAYP